MAPSDGEVGHYTDKYFAKTKSIVERFGDVTATYAVFMRRPVLSCPKLAVDWLQRVMRERGSEAAIDLLHEEGDWIGAGEPMMYI